MAFRGRPYGLAGEGCGMSHRRNIGSPLVARTAGEGRSAAVMDERADPLARVDEHDRELLERARTALKDLPIGEESIAEIVRAVRPVERRWRNVQQELVETGQIGRAHV